MIIAASVAVGLTGLAALVSVVVTAIAVRSRRTSAPATVQVRIDGALINEPFSS